MARQKQREFWVYAVHRHGERFRFRVVTGSESEYFSYETEEEAVRARRHYQTNTQQGEVTIEIAVQEYEHHLRQKGNKPRSIETPISRLKLIFPKQEMPLHQLSPAKCEKLYDDLRAATSQVTGKLITVDTHRGCLSTAKSFLNFCVAKKWLARNSMMGVDGVGKRKVGKPQLNIDEARRWTDTALRMVEAGDMKALIAMVALYMGFRASEIMERDVRDLDDEGRLLQVPDSKTPAGKRSVEIPEFLQEYCRRAAAGKQPHERLFGKQKRWKVRRAVRDICELAKVPMVCAHSMRGLHSTLAVKAGTTPHVVAASIGHTSIKTTLRHYAQPGSMQSANQSTVVSRLRTSKRTRKSTVRRGVV